MWNRAELKTRAKDTMRGHYWTAFLASLVVGLATGGAGGGSSYRFGQNNLQNGDVQSSLRQFLDRPEYVAGFFLGLSLVVVLSILFSLFVAGPLEVGGRRYFTSACCRQYDLSSLGFSFQRGRYMNVVGVQFLRGLYTFLWSLLFVIPGIVKAYAYSMVPYILADNPNLPASRAIELSCRMTAGQKWKIFVLDLSFLGWILLGALACGVGVLFVNPYIDSTRAELYMLLRHNALQDGLTTMEELCLVRN